ncbi:MAG: TIM barrel protein [Lentisphaeria bacterium]|nr:TIM barrel protein [Lentisphaeria bacterium]
MNELKNKIGVADFGVTVWDGGLYSVEDRIRVAKESGLNGVEVLRGRNLTDMVYKAAAFRKQGMEFVTCNVADDPESTFRCAAAFGCEYVWISCGRSTRDVPYDVYIRRANHFIKCAADFGVKCALHNHLGTVIESEEELHRFMADCPDAMLLLDIGHLAAMEGDVIGVIDRYFDRISAIHLKDVLIKDPSIPMGAENWWNRLEFREFGAGNIGLDIPAIIKHLHRTGFSKWLLIEQDTHKNDPVVDLSHSVSVMRNCEL